MTLETTRILLGWCTLLNSATLVFWFVMWVFLRGAIYRFHGKYFRLTEGQFDLVHYGGMAVFKLLIFVFNLVPYLVLKVVL